ncbi:MAG: metallophosphoesterase family protein [Gemmatimonadota bacterium]
MSSLVRRWLLVLSMALMLPAAARAAPPPADALGRIRFVVLGHIRGDLDQLHPHLGELIEEVRRLQPNLVLLAGDIIWGDHAHVPRRPDKVLAEWLAVDSALGTLGVPVIRAPGNHDINDPVTRDIYFQRYGRPPAVWRFHGVRFIALNSAWTPASGDTAHNRFIRGVPIDSAQLAFLEAELARPDPAPVFVFMHHLLWWAPDSAAWWREVHPLLRQAKVRAVFTGDWGPMKFSHDRRDGVDYFQNALGGRPSMEMLWSGESNRSLAAQFDNFLLVDVRGPEVTYRVMTVGGLTSGDFTPARWRRIYRERPPPPLLERVRNQFNSPARLALLAVVGAGSGVAGYLVGRRRRN